MHSLQSLLINAFWVLGLAGLLATFSYTEWYRSIRKWTFRELFRRPRALAPFYISLTCFCAGRLISEIAFSYPHESVLENLFSLAVLWRVLVWAGLSLYFIYHSFQTIIFGRRHGWDTPIN